MSNFNGNNSISTIVTIYPYSGSPSTTQSSNNKSSYNVQGNPSAKLYKLSIRPTFGQVYPR